MRIIPFIISIVVTAALIFVLNTKWGGIPPLGKFLSPQQGFWQNAEPVEEDYNEKLVFKNLKGKATVYFDERLVPHVFAEHDEDLYFVQGFLHAKFRLWQMEFQTLAAAGRVSEVLGNDPRFIRFDREQRRLGMVYAAEGALKEMEKDPITKTVHDAYTAGVNAYINTLTESTLPVEYKLLGYLPEKWSNLKMALFLKQMSKTLAGFDRDFEYTNAKSVFSISEMEKLFPQISDSSKPIIERETLFAAPVAIVKPATADSLYFGHDTVVKARELFRPNPSNGSNNWAVSGAKTVSGAPILSNDPHLDLTFPSIWYEMQLTTPTMSAYGATFPGAASVIIGFNNDIAFGFTNAQRDVKDYYQVRFKDESKKEYWFDSAWHPTQLRIEQIKVRGAATVTDTVAYTPFGPVMYDASFANGNSNGNGKTNDTAGNTGIVLRWTAHDPSNEAMMWVKLNRAKNYDQYLEALQHFTCPGQNMLFASKTGDIALWQQANFPARWYGQGMYIMPGEDSSYFWQGYIPKEQNPHTLNPASGFIQSANQRPVDSAYPYFIPGNYITARGVTIFNQLQKLQKVTVKDMMQLQSNTFSSLAEDAVPLFLKYVDREALSDEDKVYLAELEKWNYDATADSKATTIYQAWMDSLESVIWKDEFAQVAGAMPLPDEQTLVELLLKDSSFKYADDITTPLVETVKDQVTQAFQIAAADLAKEESKNGLVWYKHKDPTIYHLLRTAVTPFARKGLKVGGWSNTPNAMNHSHGPSWRMIVHLTPNTEAYGVYPGGQSGNPGSRFYDSFVDTWTKGDYYKLWMMKEEEKSDKRVRWIMTFSNS